MEHRSIINHTQINAVYDIYIYISFKNRHNEMWLRIKKIEMDIDNKIENKKMKNQLRK